MKKLLLLSMSLILFVAAAVFAVPWLSEAIAFARASVTDFSIFLGVGAIAIAAAALSNKATAKAWAHARIRLQRSVLSQGSTQCDAPGVMGFGTTHARC